MAGRAVGPGILAMITAVGGNREGIGTMQRPQVTVLGSLNMDISVSVPRLAGPGETVLGGAARLRPGGKGANQALAAARLGASVRMAGCCGSDEFGVTCRAALQAAGADVTGVRVITGAATGLALITVDAAGENSITVAPGANGLAGEAEVAAAFAVRAAALVLSAEIPVPVLTAALARARAAGVTTILNLAPVPEQAQRLLASGVDWLVVNAPEASALLGRPVAGPAGAASAAAALAADGARHVVVTAGRGRGGAQRGRRGLRGARVPRDGGGQCRGRGCVRGRAGRGGGRRRAAGRGGPARLRGRRHGGHPGGRAGRDARARGRAGGHRGAVGGGLRPPAGRDGPVRRARAGPGYARRPAERTPRASPLSAGVRSPLGEWHDAAPAGRYSAKADELRPGGHEHTSDGW